MNAALPQNGDDCWAIDMKSGQSSMCPSSENGVCPLFGGTKCYPTKDMSDEGKKWDARQIETLFMVIIDFPFNPLSLVVVT